MTPRKLPRIIEPSSVDVGDTITVTTKRGDVTETATAVVGRIVRTRSSVSFISPDGNSFGSFRYGSRARIMLLHKPETYNPEPLFDLNNIA